MSDSNRAGKEVANLSGEMAYKSYSPEPLPPNPPLELDSETLDLLVEANRQLALLDNLFSKSPDLKEHASMYLYKDALASSVFEGVQIKLEDVFDPTLINNRNQDVAHVRNYVKALEYAIERLEDLPISNRLIREVHSVLRVGVRGEDKSPGEYRYTQNWTGKPGSNLKTAVYIPPNPHDMEQAMSDLEKYINYGDEDVDLLIRASLIHYQFDCIHPFLNDNNRVGSILTSLFLIERGLIKGPVLFLSEYFVKNSIEYYYRLSLVRSKGDYEQWVKFYLQAVAESSENAITSINP